MREDFSMSTADLHNEIAGRNPTAKHVRDSSRPAVRRPIDLIGRWRIDSAILPITLLIMPAHFLDRRPRVLVNEAAPVANDMTRLAAAQQRALVIDTAKKTSRRFHF